MNINIRENIKPMSYLMNNSLEAIKSVKETKNPLILTQDGSACGVFMDMDSYQSMLDAISMLKIIQVSESAIANNDIHASGEVFSELSENKTEVDKPRLHFSDFSFAKSRELTKGYKGSFADSVLDERAEQR